MHNSSLHSTSILSKTHSQIKLPSSHIRHTSPLSRAFSSRDKQSPVTHQNTQIMLHQSLMRKNKKLSLMIKSIHGYMTNIQEMDWIMKQLQLIMEKYMSNTMEKGGIAHKIQVENIYQELVKLVSRFSGVDKKWVWEMTVPLKENRKIMNMSRNSQNYNLMNFKKTETIGSFKCTDTQNQQQIIHTDFSKIKLPSVIKQNQVQQNIQSSRYESQAKTKQYEAAIQMLKQQLQYEKKQKMQLKRQYEQKISSLNKKIDLCNTEWQTYKTYATCCIQKCKQNLAILSQTNPQYQRIETILDQIFSIQSKLDRKILQMTPQDIHYIKQQKLRQLLDIQSQLKNKREQIDKVQTQRINISQNTLKISGNTIGTGIQSELMKLLYVQATTIQHLI